MITAAELLAEIGDCRERYPDRDALAADAGQAAVAIESGKWKTAGFRRACNKRLRVAFCRLADSSRHWHPWAQTLYAQALQRGHEHPRAIRTVGRAWCRVVWQCWRNHTPYDPEQHRALQRHITVTIPTTSGPVPDLAATQRMARRGRHPKGGRRPSANRLTARRHPLPQEEVDTGRLRRPSATPRRLGATRRRASRRSRYDQRTRLRRPRGDDRAASASGVCQAEGEAAHGCRRAGQMAQFSWIQQRGRRHVSCERTSLARPILGLGGARLLPMCKSRQGWFRSLRRAMGEKHRPRTRRSKHERRG